MQSLKLIYILASFLTVPSLAATEQVPSWISLGPVTDNQYQYVICSHDGLDPEDVKQVAEAKCLASAAKLGGVTVLITQKTVQSLMGADSSEVAEIQPLKRDVKCDWTDRYLEKIGEGFRVWLRCRVSRQALTNKENVLGGPTVPAGSRSSASSSAAIKYKRGILSLTMVPQADRAIVIGKNGERVIEVASNVVTIELKEGDEYVVLRKHKYKDARQELKKWKHGDSLNHTVYLEQEM
jgi:hypothetical protein